MRTHKVGNAIAEIEEKTKEILEYLPESLQNGYRTLFILERAKDGGHNKEEKRVFNFTVTTKPEDLYYKLREFLWLKQLYSEKELRIYLSVNNRNPHKAVRNMLIAISDSLYADQANKDFVANKIVKGSRSYIMAPNAKATSLFLLDVDNEEGKDVMGETLQEMDRVGVEEVYRRATRNGWHVIVKPFNPDLWKGKAEIKKDGLLLLD